MRLHIAVCTVLHVAAVCVAFTRTPLPVGLGYRTTLPVTRTFGYVYLSVCVRYIYHLPRLRFLRSHVPVPVTVALHTRFGFAVYALRSVHTRFAVACGCYSLPLRAMPTFGYVTFIPRSLVGLRVYTRCVVYAGSDLVTGLVTLPVYTRLPHTRCTAHYGYQFTGCLRFTTFGSAGSALRLRAPVPGPTDSTVI